MDAIDTATLLLVSCVCLGSIVAAACLLILILRGRKGNDTNSSRFRATALAPVNPAPVVQPAELAQKQALVPILQFASRKQTTPTQAQNHINSKQTVSFKYQTFVSATNALPTAKRTTALQVLQGMRDSTLKSASLKYASKTLSNRMFESLRFICAVAPAWQPKHLVLLVAATIPANAKLTSNDMTDAMFPLPEDKQAAAVQKLRTLQSTQVEKTLASLAQAYANTKWPGSAPNSPTEFVCPHHYGYYPCSDPRFNDGYNPGVTQVLEKDTGIPNISSMLCCKFTNLLGDERPKVVDAIDENRKFISGFQLAAQIIAGFLLWVPGVGVGANLAIGVGIDLAIEPGMAAARDALGEAPTLACEKFRLRAWETGPKRIEMLKYKNKEGADIAMLYQSNNGCPIIYGGTDNVEYLHQVGLATKQVAKNGKFTQDKLKMYPFAKFVPGYKGYPPISCIQKCETSFGACVCEKCTNTNEAGECVRCEKVKGGGEWICGQFWDNPDLWTGNAWKNGYGTLEIGGGDVDRSGLVAG